MPKIVSVGTAVPPYEISQQQAKKFAKHLFRHQFKNMDRLLNVFEHTQIQKRHFCVPLEWFTYNHSFEEKNRIYVQHAIELSKQAIQSALISASADIEDINHVIFISSTGISTPSIDAYLFNDPSLPFHNHIKRTPIWGLGCAGGASGLSRAFEYTLAFPEEKVLVIAIEIGELAFLKDDLSKSNLVATSLFADGAAAVLVVGDKVKGLKQSVNLSILDSQSTILENSLDVMGWNVKNDGLQVIFSKDIPTIVKKDLKPNLDKILIKHGLQLSDLQFYVLHPGGTKILDAYKEIFNTSDDNLATASHILHQYGNMSSPTVLFVLQETMKRLPSHHGYGILLALGPGFSSEILLLKLE